MNNKFNERFASFKLGLLTEITSYCGTRNRGKIHNKKDIRFHYDLSGFNLDELLPC